MKNKTTIILTVLVILLLGLNLYSYGYKYLQGQVAKSVVEKLDVLNENNKDNDKTNDKKVEFTNYEVELFNSATETAKQDLIESVLKAVREKGQIDINGVVLVPKPVEEPKE